MSEERLTFRLEGKESYVSTDDGRNWQLDPEASRQLRRLGTATAGPSQAPRSLSAAARGGLGEAAALRPLDGGDPPPFSPPNPEKRSSKALGPLVLDQSRTLLEILEARSSERSLGPLDLARLATVLCRAGRVRGWREARGGSQEETRSLPSAGACHPIHLEVLSSGIPGLGAGHWFFDPLGCGLCEVEDAADLAVVGAALRARGISFSGAYTAIFVVAEFDRTLSRYPAGASLVWRDAGVLLAGLHLCAGDLGLGSCILGTTALLPPAPPGERVDLGALVLGTALGTD
jgi:SagB-type dehydrogenase family enzyme